MNVDKIILGQLGKPNEVGIYAAANLFVTPWYFIATAVIGSFAPKLIKFHQTDFNAYVALVSKISRHFGILVISIASIVTIFADSIVSEFYGPIYSQVGQVLSINIWAVVFVLQVSFRGRLLIIEGSQIYVAKLVFLGTLTNIILNLYLIPVNGAIGAAYAYTISWAMSALIYPFLFEKTRSHVLLFIGMKR